MRAVLSTKQGFQLQEVETPVPADSEVLVKVHATTVTAGDVVLRNLPGFMYWSPIRKILDIPPKKAIPGHEFAGEIVAIGKRVTRFKIGDSVLGTTTGLPVGANAEYICVPEQWETGVILRKPTNMSCTQASALPVGSMTALYLLREANIQPGKQVLIYGASGSVGTYAVQIAQALGAEVTGVCSTRNLELVKSLGAKHVIDYTKEDFTQGEETYDLILDAVGKTSPAASKRALNPNGHYTSIRNATHETIEALQYITELVEDGAITPVIDRAYLLEQTSEAYQYVGSGRKVGNVVIQVTIEQVEAQQQGENHHARV